MLFYSNVTLITINFVKVLRGIIISEYVDSEVYNS